MNEAKDNVKRSSVGNEGGFMTKLGHYVHDGKRWVEQRMENNPWFNRMKVMTDKPRCAGLGVRMSINVQQIKTWGGPLRNDWPIGKGCNEGLMPSGTLLQTIPMPVENNVNENKVQWDLMARGN